MSHFKHKSELMNEVNQGTASTASGVKSILNL